MTHACYGGTGSRARRRRKRTCHSAQDQLNPGRVPRGVPRSPCRFCPALHAPSPLLIPSHPRSRLPEVGTSPASCIQNLSRFLSSPPSGRRYVSHPHNPSICTNVDDAKGVKSTFPVASSSKVTSQGLGPRLFCQHVHRRNSESLC